MAAGAGCGVRPSGAPARAACCSTPEGGDRRRPYRLDIVQDTGAYLRLGGFLPFLTSLMAAGPYDIGHVETAYRVVVTNATPINAYRGAGRPEATAAIERAMDLFAAEIGMDPAEVRRRNLIPADKFPYQSPCGARYDTGDYIGALDKVLAGAGYAGLRAEQARRRERGDVVQLGIGVSSYVEIAAADADNGETARLEVRDDGAATVYTGSCPHGQGHNTAWAMLVQDDLGIPMDKVTMIHGDTDLIPLGTGTYASRSLQLGGIAVHRAALDVKDQGRRLAASLLEASETDLELDTERGLWHVRGDPASGRTWGEVARHAGADGLAASVHHTDATPTFPFGTHLAVAEVDTETGKVTLVRHVSVDDAGTVLNPVLAEGQRHGGIAQRGGAGAARGVRLRRRRQPAHRESRRPHPARPFRARGGRADGGQRRLRHKLLRIVHDPARRAVGEVVHRAGRAGGRLRGRDDGRAGQRAR